MPQTLEINENEIIHSPLSFTFQLRHLKNIQLLYKLVKEYFKKIVLQLDFFMRIPPMCRNEEIIKGITLLRRGTSRLPSGDFVIKVAKLSARRIKRNFKKV